MLGVMFGWRDAWGFENLNVFLVSGSFLFLTLENKLSKNQFGFMLKRSTMEAFSCLGN